MVSAAAQTLDFDTSALPNPPTTFEEQQLWEEIRTARVYPDLAAQAHLKLAAYDDRKGLIALAARERAAAGGGASQPPLGGAPGAPGRSGEPSSASAPWPGEPGPAQPPSATGLALDPTVFDLSAFPRQATDFEAQRILESLHDPNTREVPLLLAFAHRQLGRYYAARGRADLAAGEYARAVLAAPEDHRGYQGLAALIEAVGGDEETAAVLRDVSDQLQAQGYSPEGPSEPELTVAAPAEPGAWQEVSAEFNRRMNYLYTSSAWDRVYRTVFTNLYGR